jgi:hypothetical protein
MKNNDFLNILEACSDKIESERYTSEGYRREIEHLYNENIELRKRIAELEAQSLAEMEAQHG